MNVTEIFAEMDKLAAAMVEKGILKPRAEIEFKNGEILQVNLWGDGIDKDGAGLALFKGDDAAEQIKLAADHIAALPSTDERNLRLFQVKVAAAIDFGNAHGIDGQWLNPLIETSRKLSENVLTYEAAK